MATGDKFPIKLYGPWTGINERVGEQKPTDFEAAWNVELDGDLVSTRRGRALVNPVPFRASPAKFVVGIGGETPEFYDYTDDVTDGNPEDTYAPIGGLTTADEILIGFSYPINNLTFTMRLAAATACGFSVKYYSTTGWKNVSSFVDGTLGFRQSGQMTFSKPLDWACSAIGASAGATVPGIIGSSKRFWLAIVPSGTFPTARVGEVYTSEDSNISTTALKGANGLYQWRNKSGERIFIVGLDDKEQGIAKLFSYDRNTHALTPFQMPDEVKSGPLAIWRFVAIPEGLICCNGYCFLYATSKEPMVFRKFKPVDIIYEAGSNSPPTAPSFVAMFGDSLYVAEGTRVFWSMPVGDISALTETADAPLGGCNVFLEDADDARSSYMTIVDGYGGKITGIAAMGRVLLIFTARSTWVWDGSGLSCIDQEVGCVAPDSICVSNDKAFFLGQDGPYATNGSKNQPIGGGISETIGRLNLYRLGRSTAAYYAKRRQYRLFVPDEYSDVNNLGLIFHVDTGAWTKFGLPSDMVVGSSLLWKEYDVRHVISARDDEWGEELLSIDSGGNIIIEDIGENDCGKGIFWMLSTSRIKGDDAGVVSVRNVRATIKSHSTATFKAGIVHDGDPAENVPEGGEGFSGGEQVQDVSLLHFKAEKIQSKPDVFLFDGARLDVDEWCETRFFQARIPFNGKARNVRVLMYGGQDGGIAPLCMKGMDVEVIQGDERRGTP